MTFQCLELTVANSIHTNRPEVNTFFDYPTNFCRNTALQLYIIFMNDPEAIGVQNHGGNDYE